MRWVEFLRLADGDAAAQQIVLDTALAVLRQSDDSRLHAAVVSSVPTLQSLCEALDVCGIAVADDLAQDLGIVNLGVEAAWLVEQRTHSGTATLA